MTIRIVDIILVNIHNRMITGRWNVKFSQIFRQPFLIVEAILHPLGCEGAHDVVNQDPVPAGGQGMSLEERAKDYLQHCRTLDKFWHERANRTKSKQSILRKKTAPKDAICKVNTTLLTSTVYYKCLCEAAELSHNIESWNTHGHVPERSPFPLRIKWLRWVLFSRIDFVVARSSSSRRASHIVEMSRDFSWVLIWDVSCLLLLWMYLILPQHYRHCLWWSLQPILRQFRWSGWDCAAIFSHNVTLYFWVYNAPPSPRSLGGIIT